MLRYSKSLLIIKICNFGNFSTAFLPKHITGNLGVILSMESVLGVILSTESMCQIAFVTKSMGDIVSGVPHVTNTNLWLYYSSLSLFQQQTASWNPSSSVLVTRSWWQIIPMGLCWKHWNLLPISIKVTISNLTHKCTCSEVVLLKVDVHVVMKYEIW